MTPIRLACVLTLAAVLWPVGVLAQSLPAPVEAAVRSAVEDGGRAGVIVGVIDAEGTRYFAHGAAHEGGPALDADSLFGLGSVTKVFTAETLAALTVDGAVDPRTPTTAIWPDAGGEVELWRLATHRAGLPREIPTAALQADDPAPLLALLEQATPAAEPAYSNAGMAILGLALAEATGQPLAQLIQTRLTGPAGMVDTGYAPDPARLARPHLDGMDISATRPDTPVVGRGAGGLYSSADDLLTWLGLRLDPPAGREARIAALALGGSPAGPLGWQTHQGDGFTVYHHGGDGHGYQAFVGLRPDTGVGVVLLSNASTDDGLQAIALHLLDETVPLPTFGAPATVEDGGLEAFTGVWRVADDPEGNRIALRIIDGGLAYIETTPDGREVRRTPLRRLDATTFELRGAPVRIIFAPDAPATARLEAGGQSHALVRDPAD